jgi:hypothetical protein
MRAREEVLKAISDIPDLLWVESGEVKPLTSFRHWWPTKDEAAKAIEALVRGHITVNEYRALYFRDPLPC